jgi:hypothetical protein
MIKSKDDLAPPLWFGIDYRGFFLQRRPDGWVIRPHGIDSSQNIAASSATIGQAKNAVDQRISMQRHARF